MGYKTAANEPVNSGGGKRKLSSYAYPTVIGLNLLFAIAAVIVLVSSYWTIESSAPDLPSDTSNLTTKCSLEIEPRLGAEATNSGDANNLNLFWLNIGSGVIDGYYFDVGRNIARVLNEDFRWGHLPRIQVMDLSTKGSLDNINCAIAGKLQLFIAQNDMVQQYHDHWQRECKIVKEPLFKIYKEAVTIIARRDVRASVIRDLAGLEVCMPLLGSGSYQNAKSILNIALDIHFNNTKPEGLHYSDCMLAMEDGRFDAMFYTIKHPHLPLLRFSEQSSEPVQFVSIDEDIGDLHLERCSDAIKINDYPKIALWMESDNKANSIQTYNKANSIQTYCTVAAVYHTDCIDKNVLRTLRERLHTSGYRKLVPMHLRDQNYARNFMKIRDAKVGSQLP